MKKIFYIGYFSDSDESKCRRTAPSADTKMQYIIEAMVKEGYQVEVLSFCESDIRDCLWRKDSGYQKKAGDVTVRFFNCFNSRFRILRLLGRKLSWLSKKRYIKKFVCNSDYSVLIYHSLYLLKTARLLKRNGKDFVYEAEEIYSDVLGKSHLREKEINTLKLGKGYIFSTSMLSREINGDKKPELIVNGTYRSEPYTNVDIFKSKSGDMSNRVIHCVYAGILDVRKGGLNAAAAARFLPENYHIHILGYGSPEKVSEFKSNLEKIQENASAKVTYDGVLYGEDYNNFLQSCDIGLSPQNPDAEFNATSFPSKILSYMANGLRVVSIRIPAIEQSEVGSMIYYYDNQTPEEIAEAIMKIDFNDEYDSRAALEQLDKTFREKLKTLFP